MQANNRNCKIFKANTGITLVALIITIILLLILATVSISLIMNGGIIDKAKYGADKYSEQQIKERIQLAVNSAKMKSLGVLDQNSLNEALTEEFGEGNYELLLVGEGFLISVDNIEYFVDKDGKVGEGNKVEESNIEYAGDLSKNGQYDGTTEDTAYRITCIEDLVEWSNNPLKYNNKNIKLDNTLDFKSISSYKDCRKKTTDINGNGTAEELITELTTGTGFKPISSFSGTFDGQNNEIKNIYENRSSDAGLMRNGKLIKNLIISGNITSTASAYGFADSCTTIENCINKANIKGRNRVAGCVISAESMKNCCNYGDIYNSKQDYAYTGARRYYVCW